jgi:hypothetical protein
MEAQLAEPMDRGLVKELATQINNAVMPRKGAVSLFKEPRLQGLFALDAQTSALLDPKDPSAPALTDDEIAFWNRLLLERAFPNSIRKFSMEVELIRGEWDKEENVTSYRCRINFTGSECFKLFNRRVPSSLETIPLNTKALIIAKPLRPVTLENSKRIWYLEGVYLRNIR